LDPSSDVLRKIRLYGLISIVVAAILVGAAVGRQVQNVVVKGAGSVIASGSTTLVQDCLEHESGTLFTPECVSRLETLVSARNQGDNKMLFRVMDNDGVVVFSTMPEEVGSSPEEPELDASSAGETRVTIVDTEGNAALSGVDDRRVLEVLAPLQVPATGDIIGVVETYKPYTQIGASAREAMFVVWIPVAIGAMVSYAGLSWILGRAFAAAKEHELEVSSLSEHLHDSMLELAGQSLGTLQALSAAVDEKDSYTARHSLGVTSWAYHIGAAAGLSADDLATLERAGLLHDIGKIGVPETVLLKPSDLTDSEFELIKDHPGAGARILETIPFLETVVPVVRYHHERWDGTGYPEGLAGEAIPYLARILAVADAFDAMTTDRPYRKAMSAEDARREVLACAGTQFDPEIAEAFVNSGPLTEV